MTERKELHEDFRRAERPAGGSNHGFGLVFATVFGLVGGWSLWQGGWSAPIWFGLAVTFLAFAMLAPKYLAPLNRLWARFGLLLHAIVNPLVMGLLFFGTILPTGLLLRAFGKDVLRLRFDPAAASYWIPREPPGPAPDSMNRQF